jgi:hypothetical protein
MMGLGRALRMLKMTLVNSASEVQEGTPLDVVQTTLHRSTHYQNCAGASGFQLSPTYHCKEMLDVSNLL